MIGVFIAIIGLIIGSFLNVCIFRIPREESLAFPPSHCMKCDAKIKPYDLVPVLSYAILRGKCRKCGDKISIRYPLIELLTGSVFFLTYLQFGFSFELIKFLILSCFLIVIGMIDYDTTDVYTEVSITGIVIGLLFLGYALLYGSNAITFVFGAILGGVIIASIILLTHGMGWGDCEICVLCGLYLGFKLTIVMLFFSFIIGGIIGMLLIAFKIKSRKDYIPFGPFIVIGAFIAIFLGDKIINYYLNFL